jgi:hypothetical protein
MQRISRRYHRIDGWRGFWIPGTAVAGASDTGTWDDSPCPSPKVKAEIRRLQREVLRPAGIASRQCFGASSNVFCAKRWLCVSPLDFAKAQTLVNEWLKQNESTLQYVHDAV